MESGLRQATSHACFEIHRYTLSMKILSTLLATITLLTATSALARDDRGRTRTYTGMTPYESSRKVVCSENGRRCWVQMSSSSSSSVSSIRPAPISGNRRAITDLSVFVPFVKKYVTLPEGWTGDVSDKLATFTKKSSTGQADSTFYVQLYDYQECDSDSIETRMNKAWAAVSKKSPERITVGRAYGVQGLAFSWVEPGTGDAITRNFCIIPQGYIMTVRVWTNDADAATKNVIERYALPDLYTPRRGR